MQKHEDNLAARINGNALQPLAGASVTVTSDATDLPAALYSDDGVTPLAQPIITGNEGQYAFYAANGEYTVTFSGTRFATFTRKVILADPSDNPYLTQAAAAAPTGAAQVGWLRSAVGAIASTIAKWLGWQDVHVFEFMTPEQIADVQARTLAMDVTEAVQKAIDHTASNGEVLKLAGWMKVTDSLRLTQGARIRGNNFFPSDWRVPLIPGTKIKLVTSEVKDLFTVDQTSLNQGYVWNMHVANVTLEGSDIAGSRGMYLKRVAESVFENIGIQKFGRGLEVEFGMMNEYNRINSSKCLEASFYLNGADITTSQTFNRCFGRESPWAWVMESTATGHSIGTILNGCLVESTTAGGVNQHKSCSAEYNSMYCENAPDDNFITNGTLMRLFKDGVDVDPFRSTAVFNGGDLAGGNFGLFTASNIIDVGSAKSVVINGTELKRATNGIVWDATTADGAIRLNNPSFISIANLYTGPSGKMVGMYPNGVLTAARKNVINAEQIGLEGTWTGALVPATGSIAMSAATGGYIRAGKNVSVSGLFVVGSVAAPAGLLKLTGLPFVSAGGYQSQVPALVNIWFATGMTTQSITGVINPGTSYIEIGLYTNGSPQSAGAVITAGTQIHVSATYPAA